MVGTATGASTYVLLFSRVHRSQHRLGMRVTRPAGLAASIIDVTAGVGLAAGLVGGVRQDVHVLTRPEGKRLHLVLGDPWKEALAAVMRGGSARDLWRWAAPMDKGDLLLTAINTRPKMFVVLETLAAASGATSMTLRIDEVELLSRMVPVDAVKRRLGRERLVVPSLPSDALADELLDAVRAELAESSPFSDWEGTRRDSSSRDRSSGLQAMALQWSDGSCSGCERPVGAMLDGRGFASLEVHHLDKLACSGGHVETTLDRLTVVCGACHNLLHVQRSPTLQEIRYAWRPACPAGHRSALRFERTDQLVAEDVISLGCLEPPAGHPQWRCAECGTEWGDISTAE